MISKINKFYPNIKLSKIFLLALISFGYGAATIITIYIVTSLVSIISGAQTLDTSALIALLTEMLKAFFYVIYFIQKYIPKPKERLSIAISPTLTF